MRRAWTWSVMGLLAGGAWALVSALASQGHPPVLPLDDAYIALQYARVAAEGSFAAYTPGGAPSFGVTSVLWWILLTAAAALSGGEALPRIALVLNALALTGLGVAILETGRHHGCRGWSVCAGLAALLSPLWWFGMFNGLETGLYAALLLAAAYGWSVGRSGWLIPLACVRPEGAIIAGMLGIGLWWRGGRRRPSPALGATVGLAAITLLLPWLVTGAGATAWAAKGMFTEPPGSTRDFYHSRVVYFAGRTLWFGLSGARPQPALDVASDLFRPSAWIAWAWCAFTGGGVLLTWLRGRGRSLSVLWVAATLPALLMIKWDAHHYRYLIPGWTLLLAAAGVGWFGEGATPPRLRRGLGSVLLAVIAVGSAAEVWPRFRPLYRGECELVASYQERVGTWIDDHLPPKSRVAAHDAGAIAFLGNRPLVDLVGLVTPPLAGLYRHGEGALWEGLDALPLPGRPTHAAVLPAWMPYLMGTGWAHTLLWSETGTRRRAVAARGWEVWEVAWPVHGLENRPQVLPPGWAVADRLDMADLVSERAHRYRGTPAGKDLTVVRHLGFGGNSGQTAIEGGRDLGDTAEFVLRGDPGRPSRLLVRSASPHRSRIVARIGEHTATLTLPQGESRFAETGVDLPPGAWRTEGEAVRIQVQGTGARIFQWWLIQPEAP